MLLIGTLQEKNQIAGALRIFQAIRHNGGSFQEIDGSTVTVDSMEHFEDTPQLSDDEIEAMVDKVYEPDLLAPQAGCWGLRPDFDDDEDEPNGHTLLVDSDNKPILVTCRDTKAEQIVLAAAAPEMLTALLRLRYLIGNSGHTRADDEVAMQLINQTIGAATRQ